MANYVDPEILTHLAPEWERIVAEHNNMQVALGNAAGHTAQILMAGCRIGKETLPAGYHANVSAEDMQQLVIFVVPMLFLILIRILPERTFRAGLIIWMISVVILLCQCFLM